ncbi:hypothetical protein GW756_01015 [bacterium]|nr:hypothetical protein [bacterium]NCQ54937.1 hypothetical protein [Candidatus Parcubacteria bacterium]NCS66981.1 hypothetical protein [Candidatus Peregrinibacteria bacterium]NCS95927.1 hypothetical protein [bacterium]
MRLKLFFWYWLSDQQGFVVAFTALVLPVILMLGVLVLQSGQLYIRQAQLQFSVRQAANSGLIPLAQALKAQAEANYQNSCEVEFPPDECDSSSWQDFLSSTEAHAMAAQANIYEAVESEVTQFLETTDPKLFLAAENLTLVFPVPNQGDHRISARVLLKERQISWLGNILRPEDYSIEVEALSYLNLES